MTTAADPVRAALRALMAERGLTKRPLSRAIGKGDTFIHDFLERSVPQRLDEETREALGRALGVDPWLFHPDQRPPAVAMDPGRMGAALRALVERLGAGAAAADPDRFAMLLAYVYGRLDGPDPERAREIAAIVLDFQAFRDRRR